MEQKKTQPEPVKEPSGMHWEECHQGKVVALFVDSDADTNTNICPCCGQYVPATTEAEKTDQQIQQQLASLPPLVTPWFLLAMFGAAAFVAIVQWVAA